MRSKTLFVWLVSSISLMLCLLTPQMASAQINVDPEVNALCIEDPALPSNGVVDELTDRLQITVRAAYSDIYCDSVRAGLDPSPPGLPPGLENLGELLPLVPVAIFSCPSGVTDLLYEMTVNVTLGQGLNGAALDSCLVVATLTFFPGGANVDAGDVVGTGVTWLGYDDDGEVAIPTVCLDFGFTFVAPCDIRSGCALINYREGGGIAFDGIVAIGDTVWMDSTVAASIDTMAAGDTLVWDGSALTCDIADVNLFYNDTIIVAECAWENGLVNACHNDTIWLYYVQWDAAGGDDFFDGTVVDSVPCVRPIDNSPPTLDQACIDSCTIIQNNYLDNDSIAGCGDVFVIWMSTIQNGFPTRTDPDWNCDGDSVLEDVSLATPWYVDCDTNSQNFDVSWMAVRLSDIVPLDSLFPMNEDSIDLLSLDSVWVSARFGTTANPGSANDLMYIEIPIDTVWWDYVQMCVLEGLIDGDTIYVHSIDDAGNASNASPFGDSVGTLVGCDACLDNVPPDLPGSDIYWSYDGVDNFCNQRFSPYDSALATFYINLSPDSIRWYLDAVDSVYDTTNYLDVLENVYLIGFDVRQIPDDDPDTPTGAPITLLDYFHPMAKPDSINWDWRSPYVPGIDSSACFTWYGKDGPDSLDPDFDFLSDYCPWGMLVGITEARYMDAGGCNAVLGSDHDGSTSILDGYTQLNALYSVVDSCFPTTTITFDLDTLEGPALGLGPDYGSVNDPYLWTNGENYPFLKFKARRFYTQGMIDTCLAEQLCYTVKIDSLYTQGPWPFAADSFYINEDDAINGGSDTRTCRPIEFFFNDINSDTISFEWEFDGPGDTEIPDGLYCLSLELQDNAGNVFVGDTICIWKNGLGPAIDSVAVVNDNLDCTTNFFIGESLCVWIQTDTTATEVLFDFSCILNIDSVAPDQDTVIVTTPYAATNTFKRWYACLLIQPGMVDSSNTDLNDYRINPYEPDCEDGGDYGIISVIAYDSDGNSTEATEDDGTCVIALLGPSRCPRIVGPIEFWYYDPDTVFSLATDINANYTDIFNFDNFGPMPDWNAFSPGSVDSAGAYNSMTNPAHDQVHDSIWVRLLIDTLSITQADNFGDPFDDDVYHDTLVVEFRNPDNSRSRYVRKPLFRPGPTCTNYDGIPPCQDPPDNTIYDGRLELDEHVQALAEFRYMWNGTWFVNAGADSQMLVPITGQDTIIVAAWTVDGDSMVDSISVDSIFFLVCDTTFAELDVDNENPEFLEWTGIAAGVREEDTHSTATVDNIGWDGDCGFRYAEGDTFQLVVRASEQVHYDSLAYPNTDGSDYGVGGIGDWIETGQWQISLVDSTAGLLIENPDNPGTYVTVELLSVTPDSLANNEWQYTLVGTLSNLPVDTFIYNACFVIRGAWDQGGNPGRYNEPSFSDAFEDDSFEDTTFCLHLIPCDPWAAGCPDVYGPDNILGWIAPEDTNITVCATIIETCELTMCTPGVREDSLRVVEGDFQRITDDPNPWILPDSVGDWFIYYGPFGDSLGWARMYYWQLRADSSDLATIWCDGDFLDFEIRFVSWEGVRDSMTFDECVQVDVNEPRWVEWNLYDSTGTILDELDGALPCAQPDQTMTLMGCVWDSGVDCEGGEGIGVDTSMIWADLSQLLQDAAADSVEPDCVVVQGVYTGVYPYVGPPVQIFDNSTSEAVIDDPDAGEIIDVNVTIGNLEHTYVGDLALILESPDGTQITLVNDEGDSGNNFVGVIFDDEAATDITSISASDDPFTGSYYPEGNLSSFDGENPNGTWTLYIDDDADEDEGFLYSWSLEITYRTGPDLKVQAFWTFVPDSQFFCINTVDPWFRFHAAHDIIGHHDRELYMQDTLNFCSDCVPPYIYNAEVYCECDTLLAGVDPEEEQGDLHFLSTGSDVRMVVNIADVDSDSSLGLAYDFMWADLSSIDTTLSWEQGACFWSTETEAGDTTVVIWGDVSDCVEPGFCAGNTPIELNAVYNNGETIYVRFALADSAGNVDTVLYAVGVYDSLPPIVDFIYTIGDDSIRGYVSPGDDHIHVFADINGYAADLVSAPEHVWADFSQFQCDSASKSWYDTVYANYVEDLGGGNYRAWWGWYPGSWTGDPFDLTYLIPGDTTSLPWDTLSACESCSTWEIGAEGTYDSLWVYVTDAACNAGQHFNVWEASGCDSTTPGLDSVWVWGNNCEVGWISSTPLDSGHIEVWAWMDTTFNELIDTLMIDSLQVSLIQLGSPRWDHTNWSTPEFFGGWPVYGTDPTPDSTKWEIIEVDGRNRLVGKWLWLTADGMGDCEQVIVPVKSIRQTGLGGSHGYYMDVEYGYARVDTTRPVIYDMRVHSNTTTIAETTWVTPNYPLCVEFWAYDTSCDPEETDHIGFDLTHGEGGPGPWISFQCGGILDSLWTWDTTAFEVTWYNGWNGVDPIDLDSASRADSICIKFTGQPVYDDSCNAIDLDDLEGCVTAYIEDCLSNPAVPVTKTVTTDDRPPMFVNSLPWGDYTIATGFPGDPDINGIDSVLVLQNSNYGLDWDSTMFVYVIVDNAPGDTLMSWEKTYIDFTGFMNDALQYPDSIYYNIDGNHRDSILWVIPLYDDMGGGALFNTNIVSDRYWWHLYLSDSLCNRASFYCMDLDSAVSFTIQNWTSPTTGMLLLCDSNTVAGSDTDFVDMFNMDLWNNEKVSPDEAKENLYKIWYSDDSGYWNWYSHEDVNQTRFFVFVEDTVLQSDDIDNDNDGLFDETGEGVDFYTADLRINEFPQVGHVDSMNVEGVWINYLWFADNFSEGRYDVKLYISDIYGHRDTLACGDFALTFYEDETCPYGTDVYAYDADETDTNLVTWCWNGAFTGSVSPNGFTADDSIFVGDDFDSLVVFLYDPMILDQYARGSGVDFDTTTTVDSTNWNAGLASSVRLLDPNGAEVAFVQVYDTSDGFAYDSKPIYLIDPTGNALEGHPDGEYTINVVALDNMGNSCEYNWTFVLDRTCPDIADFFVTHPGQIVPQADLFTSWDYVELRANVFDSLGVFENVRFDYAFDANRDGEVDAYTYWQTRNIWVSGSSSEDGHPEWPYAAYWNIRNLTWNSEDTLGLPPVNPDSCLNTWFVRVHAWDKFGNYCADTITVHITDDIAPLAYISSVDGDETPQSALLECFEPNVDTDSLIELRAFDFQGGLYDPLPGDTTFAVFSYSNPETDLYFDSSDPYETTIEVTEDFSLLDVNVVLENLDGPYQGCLYVELESPNGTIVTLMDDQGEWYWEWTEADIVLDDEAFMGMEFYGDEFADNDAYWPYENLSVFDGESSLGTWTLRVWDDCGYSGELGGWGLVLTERPIGGLATYQWFDLAKGMFQFKYFEAPGVYTPGNADPATGWVTIQTPGQDSVTYRQPGSEDFVAMWNVSGLQSHQYNLRFLSADVCDNVDALNTPVITVRIECDTTAPLALICFPTPDLCVTNMHCDTTAWVPVQSTAPIMSDVDSIAYFFVDSLSVPGLGIHQFIGGTNSADSVVSGWAYYHSTAWNTDNLLSGWYWLYAVAYDDAGLYDTDPIWTRVFVDNTAPMVTECWIGDYNSGDMFASIQTVGEGNYFYLRANAEDNIGLDHNCGISGVQFQFLDRFGNWKNLESANDWYEAWGADVYCDWNYGFVYEPSSNGYYELGVYFQDFGNSPLDSVRFRAYAIDNIEGEGWGQNNTQGDANRDCNLDRDLTCGEEICCSAIEIRDALPEGTNLWCFNHAWFQWGLPQYSAPTTPIFDGDKFSVCNYQTPLDTMLFVANVHEDVEDEWLMYFKYWRADGSTDTFDIPNDFTLNPALPRNADGAVVLESTWDSVYVVWTGARAWLDSADAADGLEYARWDYVAYVEDLTGNQEPWWSQNTCFINTFCPPNTPITDVTYVTNDVADPENRVRVTEEVSWQDDVTDTVEVLYNRTTDYGSNDPEALVQFYVDADAIRNCHADSFDVFNVELWQLADNGELEALCDEGELVDFDYFSSFKAWDQFPPDMGTEQYEFGVYFDNSYAPGTYNFAVVVNWVGYDGVENDTLNEGDTDCDGSVEESDFTRIDLVVRIVNVNEPQVVFCYPNYGDVCGAHNTVPLSANDVSDPNYFSGDIDTVWFQRWDGDSWVAVTDAITGRSYDTQPGTATVRFELDEKEVPGMAGWYYEMSGNNTSPVYSWYADRDLFPDVAVYVWELDQFFPMADGGAGFWTADIYLNHGDDACYNYSFVIDANDNNIWENPGTDRWVDDPRNLDWDDQDPIAYDRCSDDQLDSYESYETAFSTLCLCEYVINFNSITVGDGHHEFRTVVGWHDDVAYHVIENPAPGDSLHVFFVDNDEPGATHDIEFDNFWLNGGRCDTEDFAYFVTDIQPVDGDYRLVVEDICAVIYQVSLTSSPQQDSSWRNVYTVYSNDDMGWTEAWPGEWEAYNPLEDDIDNDGDGLVDETYDVQAGDGRGEENTLFWSRSIVTDHCGNTYCTNAESLWVDVSEPRACVELIGGIEPGVNGNDVIIVPDSRDLEIVAVNQDYAGFDPSILGVFQYRTLNPIGPWTNIQADEASNDTTRHDGDTLRATWDLLTYFEETGNDPEGWYQLRVIAIDTVNNTDMCDNDVCYVTIRLNDNQPAARIAIHQIISEGEEVASSCTTDSSYYMQTADDPYCIQAVFAPTNIDTGLASITFQYAEVSGDVVSNWRNIETIYDPINNGLNGDTTQCVYFQPQPEDVGDQEIFWIRAIVEDYNGNDTSDAVVLYIDALPPTGAGTAVTTAEVATACGDRCWLDITPGAAMINMLFDADELSGEFNEDEVWLTAVREDSNYWYNFGAMTRSDDDEWYFDFGGDLCDYWRDRQGDAGLDYGCYIFTVHFTDCQGNEDSVQVSTTCDGQTTNLVCIDCYPAVPEHTDIQSLSFQGYDCVEEDWTTLYDNILDGTTEIGGEQAVSVAGVIPSYEQDIWYMVLYVESEDAGVAATAVDTFWWNPTYNSHEYPGWNISWNLADTTDEGAAMYPSGYYRVWARAHDAICQIEPIEMLDEFWVHVDHAEPVADITEVNGEPVTEENTWIEINAGEDNPATLWIEWTDGLNPDDSTQTNNIVELWCKNIWHPNQADAWTQCGTIPSPCNPHYAELDLTNITCGDSLHVIAIAQDRWENGDLDVERVMSAFDEGHAINIYIFDTTPPSSMVWSVGLTEEPWCDDDRDQGVNGLWIVDQQTNTVSVGALGDIHDIWLQAFTTIGDDWPSINGDVERVYFEYSFDGTTWFEIGVDEEDSEPCAWEGEQPNPWWDGVDHDIFWSVVWDVSGMAGDVWVRSWAQDECGNSEEMESYIVSFDVMAPMAQVFVWENGVNVDQLETCDNWTEPQIGDSVERFTMLTVGACADEVEGDAYGAHWFIKRAEDHPLEMWSWCYFGDDSTGPFSVNNVDLWHNDCPAPQPGLWYDVAVLTTDQAGNELTWTQFLNYGQGMTVEEKWAWLMANGYVKRFYVADTQAPTAHDLQATPDCTPDSSVIFLHGDITLTAEVDDEDVEAVTFAFLEVGSNGPWTVIERASREHGIQSIQGPNGEFVLAEGTWNTELLNGTYWLGAFAEDNFGNMDGDLSMGAEGRPAQALWQVNIDNEAPEALIVEVWRDGVPVTNIERGAEHTFVINASDNFGLRQVELYYRAQNGEPEALALIDTDGNFPYSFNWTAPTTMVVTWQYDFLAVATDLCEWTDMYDAQGSYLVDWTATVVDEEANLSITTIGGYPAEETPHVNGENVCIEVSSEPNLDYVRFVWIRGGDTTEIETIQNPVGTIYWNLCGWDVTTIDEGPAQLCAIGSADLGGDLVTMAQDCRNIVIDHSLAWTLTDNMPDSHGLVGGYCLLSGPITIDGNPDDVWVRFNNQLTDAGLDTVWFEWKNAADPNDDTFWSEIGYAYQDAGVTGNWIYSWDAYDYFEGSCLTISLRAVLSDNAVPTSNLAYVLFADSVRVDNCPPDVQFTNVNGDMSPEGTVVPWGEIVNMVATAQDIFGNGGNSDVDSVCFYGGNTVDEVDLISCDTQGPLWSAQVATTDIGPNNNYYLRVVAWDEAGNCSEHAITIYVEDSQFQRACIVGFDADNEFACNDYLYAVTDDCDTNWTAQVQFQISLNQGGSWIPLADAVNTRVDQCNEWLGWHLWQITLEFDEYPANAWFRAVAWDESGNVDPNAAIWRRQDVTVTEEVQIWTPDWVRVPSNGEQQPWVLTTLEDYTENCLIEAGVVCIEPEAGSSFYAGELPLNTRPCQLEDEDGQITVFTSNKVQQGDNIFTQITTYSMDIHEANYQGGSNGTLVSEDGALEVTIPAWGTGWAGSLWFESYLPSQSHSLVPAYQYYYTLISNVVEIQSDDLDDLDIVQPASSFRMHFDNSLLPENAEEWQVVVAYWNWDDEDESGQYNGMWQEWGITYNDRDLENGIVDFQWTPDWDVSDLTSVCPDRARFAVFITSIRPISENVHLNNGGDCDPSYDESGLNYYNGVPVTDCNPQWWVVLGQGEYPPTPDRVDVWLDGIRIVNDGEPAYTEGWYEENQCDGYDVFIIDYDEITGIMAVSFNPDANSCGPWFGCLTQGTHTIQYYLDDRPTNVTPFYVDLTPPTAHTEPTYIGDVSITLWADLVDRESGIDTVSVYLDLANCGVENSQYVHEVTAEAMTFEPIYEDEALIGYRASVTVQWDGLIDNIFYDWYDEETGYYFGTDCPLTLCAHWHVYNNVCNYNDETQDYRYTVDIVPPVITPVSPIGDAIDDDGDGTPNEDPVDCSNNDGDFFWTHDWGWSDRYDEDPINFAADTFNCGERLPIQGSISDWGRCCYGAAGVNLSGVQFVIDGVAFTAADTTNEGLNFFINSPGQNDFVFNFGGPTSGEAADMFYTPGPHSVAMFVPDNAGNIGTTDAQSITWNYYVACPGPAVDFNEGACGTWFNPEYDSENPVEFNFIVTTVASAPIAPNGISYTVSTVPDGIVVSGPTTVDPAGEDTVEVEVMLDGSFPDGQTGLAVTVETRNIHFVAGGDNNGYNMSARTYTADGCEPVETAHFPATDDSVQNEGNVVVEVQYNDDCNGVLFNIGDGNQTLTKGMSAASRVTGKGNVASKNEASIGRDERETLDDNGSGIITDRVWFVVVPPRGEVLRYEDEEDFIERTRSSAKVVLVDPIAGVWTVNAYAEDCVGNLATWTWTFRVLSTGPIVEFGTVEDGSCQYNGFWNPDFPLDFTATVQENDGANVRNGDIAAHFVGLYDNDGQITEYDLTANVSLDINPAYDNGNTNQTFTVNGTATFGDFGGHGTPNDIRIVLTAGDQYGMVTEIVQTWVVDETAPVVQVISPLDSSVVNGDLPVTISAHFFDDEEFSAVGMPGNDMLLDKNVTPATGFIGTGNKGEKSDKVSTISTTKLDLGAWRDALSRGFSSLDGNSGVDPQCIEMFLHNHSTGVRTELTPESVINGGIITWSGNLEDGAYSVILTVCDYVCNTSSKVWSFQVVGFEGCLSEIYFLEPFHVSAMPHCFEASFECDQVDRSTVTMTLEGAMLVDDQLVWAPIVVEAPVTFSEGVASYCANFDLTGLQSIRATLNGSFSGGAPMAPITQVYTVDTGAPIFTNVDPASDPENPLAIGEALNFRVDFAEVGTVGLDPESIRIWWTTEDGGAIEGTSNVSIAGNGLTGYATLALGPQTAGVYYLHADVSDLAGNRATEQWMYRVGHEQINLGGETYNYPNPFTKEDGHTTFVLPIEPGSGDGAYVSIMIYDFSGRFVAKVFDGVLADNNASITWAGTNDKGEEVANGVYLANVKVTGDGVTLNNIVKVAYKKASN